MNISIGKIHSPCIQPFPTTPSLNDRLPGDFRPLKDPSALSNRKILALSTHLGEPTGAWITAATVQKIFATIFTLVFLAAIQAPPELTVSLALCLGGAVLSIRDYDSHWEVANYREECVSFTLKEAFDNHGKYVWERKLLSQEQVVQKFLAEQERLRSLPSIRTHHAQTLKLLKGTGFTLPSVEETCVERFRKECASLKLEKTVELHGLDTVFSLRLYSPEDFRNKFEERMRDLFVGSGLKAVTEEYEKTVQARDASGAELYSIPTPLSALRTFCTDIPALVERSDLLSEARIRELLESDILNESEAADLRAFIDNVKKLQLRKERDEARLRLQIEEKINQAESLILFRLKNFHGIDLSRPLYRMRIDPNTRQAVWEHPDWEGDRYVYRYRYRLLFTDKEIELFKLYDKNYCLPVREKAAKDGNSLNETFRSNCVALADRYSLFRSEERKTMTEIFNLYNDPL